MSALLEVEELGRTHLNCCALELVTARPHSVKARVRLGREEHRLRVFENRVLSTIFGPKRDEVTGEWRKLHNEEFRDLYSSPSTIRIIKSRRIRWAAM
jgi:hypothetical protein